MIIYIIRHGEPDYQHDTLTTHGFEQAKKLGERLKNLKIDKLYVSTHGRTIATAQPIIDNHKEIKPLFVDWAREDNNGKYYFKVFNKKRAQWYFFVPKFLRFFKSEKMLRLGNKWFKDRRLKDTTMSKGYEQMSQFVDDFVLENGFKHNRKKNCYEKIGDSPKVVVIVAHGGFAHSFISNLLDIPYPIFTSTHRDMNLAAITKINLDEEKHIPYIDFYNDDTHLNQGSF